MNLESNWKSKTLENLEKEVWSEPEYLSHLVVTCHKLRKKQLKDFNIENLRIMIGQSIGLKYLIPLALEKLSVDILTEGDFYKGDLLKSVLISEVSYWKRNKERWLVVCNLIKENLDKLEEAKQDLLKVFEDFEKIND